MQKKYTQRFNLLLVYILKAQTLKPIFCLLFAFIAFTLSAFAINSNSGFASSKIKFTDIKALNAATSPRKAVTPALVVADNPRPVLNSLSKDCISQGYNQDLYVTLSGEKFVQGARVRISRSGFTLGNFVPSSVSADGKTIESVVPAGWLQLFLLVPGAYTIQVVNPLPADQGGVSNALIFTVYPNIITGSISGKASVCAGEANVVYSVPDIAASYVWDLPPGTTLVNNSESGNQVTINFNNATSGPISVTAVNGCGDPGTKSTLNIAVNNPPQIDRVSIGVPVCINREITLTVDARGTNLDYQWYKRSGDAASIGVRLNNGGTIAGANTSTLTISSAVAADAGYYYVDVSNICNQNGVQSVNAEITINPVYINNIADIQEPEELLIGQPATYSVTPSNNSLVWQYTWTILYNTNPATSETISTGTIPNYTIASVRPDMAGIIVSQLPPPGIPCVDAINNVQELLRTPLPVELLYLKATKQNNNVVELEWATAMEQNSEGFEVQVAQDAQNYRTLAFVASKAGGNTNEKQVYTFHDKENGKYGTRYYRLMQRDRNGDAEYFGPKAVQIGEATESLSVYPNPFTSEVILDINAEEAGTMHVIVTNAIGAKVLERTLNIQKGSNKQKLQFNGNLPLGMYHLTTRLNGKTNHIKLMKR